jgi:hypothetical protein
MARSRWSINVEHPTRFRQGLSRIYKSSLTIISHNSPSRPLPPLLMHTPQIHRPLSLQIRCQIRLLISLFSCPPIPEPIRESIATIVPVLILPVLPSRLFTHQCNVSRTPRPYPMDAMPGFAAICPSTTVICEHRPRKESVRIGAEVISGLLRRRHGLDALGGHLPEQFGVVC